MELLGEVALVADLADRLLLGLQPVDVVLLAGQDLGEELAGAVVALGDAHRDAAVEALDGGVLELDVELELLGHGLADAHRAGRGRDAYDDVMHGDDEIIELLNEVLTAELTAINQYFIHAKMCRNWGYDRLAEHIRDESIDEMKHAEVLIDRILYFDGVPNMQRLSPLHIGETVAEQFEADLQVEYAAVERLNHGIAVCVAKGDNGTRELLAEILVSEEEHIDWLETQQETIRQIGIENYLAQQLHV